MLNNSFPILEFDKNRVAKITASSYLKKTLPEYCVISFFREAIKELVNQQNTVIIDYLHSEILDIPIYELESNGKKVCLTMPFATAPGAAGTIEELHAMGANKFLVCGAAGCLRDIALGKVIIPVSAVRDEGTSYHYLRPDREVQCNINALNKVKKQLNNLSIPYMEGKTWTTDAFYRETHDKIEKRIKEGCVTVEMECAAFYAVAEFYSLPLVQIFYAGDNLDCDEWDCRDWNKQFSVRQNIINLSLKLVGEL